MYCNDNTDGKSHKGWGQQFRIKYAEPLYSQIV